MTDAAGPKSRTDDEVYCGWRGYQAGSLYALVRRLLLPFFT